MLMPSATRGGAAIAVLVESNGVALQGRPPRVAPDGAIVLAMMLKTNTNNVMISAPDHASERQSSYGLIAN
jgi:hypothetical protein